MKVVPVAGSSPTKQDVLANYESDNSSGIYSEESVDENSPPVAPSGKNSRKSRKKPISKLAQQRNEVKAKVVKEVLEQVLPDMGAFDMDGTSRVRKESKAGKFVLRWLKIIGCLELDLHDAVLTGSINRVRGSIKKIMKEHENYQEHINQYDENGYTPLSLATKINDADMVEALLDAGAMPDMVDEVSGRTPLFFSILQRGHVISQLLLTAGATVNMPDFKCITPLMVAVSKNDLKHCQMLCQKYAELDVQDENGWTALHYGVMANSIECVKYLVEEGADKDIKDINKRKALHIAKYKQYGECIATLSANSKIL